jgi:hypothetical protein
VLIIVSCLTDSTHEHAFGLAGYRSGIVNLRKLANDLVEQNDLIAQAVIELEAEADVVKGIEAQLSEIARRQGVSAKGSAPRSQTKSKFKSAAVAAAASPRISSKSGGSRKRGDADDNFSGSGAGSGRSTRSADKAMNVPSSSRSSGTSSAPLYRRQIDDEQSMTSTSTAASAKRASPMMISVQRVYSIELVVEVWTKR